MCGPSTPASPCPPPTTGTEGLCDTGRRPRRWGGSHELQRRRYANPRARAPRPSPSSHPAADEDHSTADYEGLVGTRFVGAAPHGTVLSLHRPEEPPLPHHGRRGWAKQPKHRSLFTDHAVAIAVAGARHLGLGESTSRSTAALNARLARCFGLVAGGIRRCRCWRG